MIDRSYLPFKSAKEYIDRGMAKWMGFFISEHSSSLSKEDDTIDYSIEMRPEEILLLLSQSYINGLAIVLYTKRRKLPFSGIICEISNKVVYFKSEGKILKIKCEEILSLELKEYSEDNLFIKNIST